MALHQPAPIQLDPRAIRTALRLSRERMARLLDVSTRTIRRWEARAEAPANRAMYGRLVQLKEITDLGFVVYTPEGLDLFLKTPLPVIDGRTALEVIELGEGQRVLAALASDYEGLGS